MRRIPGLSSLLFLLTVVLCLAFLQAIVQGWGTAALLTIFFSLAALVLVLILLSVQGGLKFVRHSRRQAPPDPKGTIRRLVKSLSSKDRKEAKQAARLLGELASETSPAVESPFAADGQPAWRRWNDWWVAYRRVTHSQEDHS